MSDAEYLFNLIDAEECPSYLWGQLQVFEQTFSYPFGQGSRFQISHNDGEDYFTFHKQMGTPRCCIAQIKADNTNIIIGIGCVIARPMKSLSQKTSSLWYLCDWKIAPYHQGKGILTKLLNTIDSDLQSDGYAVSMIPPLPKDVKPYSWISLYMRRNQRLKNVEQTLLNIYSFNFDEMHSFQFALRDILIIEGQLSSSEPLLYKDNKKIKDFFIYENQSPHIKRRWPLLHLQHGPFRCPKTENNCFESPQLGHEHMIAAISGSSLDRAILNLSPRITPSATAILFTQGIAPINFVLTNEI